MKKHFPIALLFIFVILNFYIWGAVIAGASNRLLTVAFLDIGQGDAIFIESPTGVQVLIDGGSNGAVLRQLQKVMPFQDRSIDALIATHADKDHIGGLSYVLERYDVSTYINNGATSNTNTYKSLENAVENEKGINRILARRGMVLDLGEGATLTIIFPDRDISRGNANDGSIVAKLKYGESTFLLTGDSPKKIEKYLISLDGEYLDVDVLKPGHHGSKTSSTEAFIEQTSPEYAVISAGMDNKYGHPHKEVIDILDENKVNVLGTYEEGTIIFLSDGEKVWLKK